MDINLNLELMFRELWSLANNLISVWAMLENDRKRKFTEFMCTGFFWNLLNIA